MFSCFISILVFIYPSLPITTVKDKKEKDFLVDTMPDFEFLGFIPYEKKVVQADMANLPLSGAAQNIFEETREIARRIKKGVGV